MNYYINYAVNISKFKILKNYFNFLFYLVLTYHNRIKIVNKMKLMIF